MSLASQLRRLANRLDTPGARWAEREHIPLKLYQLFERIKSSHAIRTILDVGANRGVFASRVTRCFPGIPIHAFEPLPGCQERLARLAAEYPHIKLHPVAVGDQCGQIEMFENDFNESSSILPMMDRHRQLWPQTKHTQPIFVPITTLDAFTAAHSLVEPVFLKIDVQGYELSVLRGSTTTLRQVAVAVMEVNFERLYAGQAEFFELVEFMAQSGFRFIEFADEIRVPPGGRLIYADAVFESARTAESPKP
jgi:FkbM family methyltransferase